MAIIWAQIISIGPAVLKVSWMFCSRCGSVWIVLNASTMSCFVVGSLVDLSLLSRGH